MISLDVNTMAFDKIFDSIAEGVVVYNRRDKITYCNRGCRTLAGGCKPEMIWNRSGEFWGKGRKSRLCGFSDTCIYAGRQW